MPTLRCLYDYIIRLLRHRIIFPDFQGIGLPRVYLGLPTAVYLGSTRGLPKVYPRSTQGIPRVYPGSTLGVPPVYPRYTPGLPWTYPGFTPGLHRVYPGSTHSMPTRERGRVGLRHMGKRNPENLFRTKLDAERPVPRNPKRTWIPDPTPFGGPRARIAPPRRDLPIQGAEEGFSVENHEGMAVRQSSTAQGCRAGRSWNRN